MFLKKQTYEQPSCEFLVVRFGEGILSIVSGGANWGNEGGNPGGEDGYGDNDGEGF